MTKLWRSWLKRKVIDHELKKPIFACCCVFIGVMVIANKTFGVPLDDLLRKSEGCDVPPVITTIVEYLEKHG